MIIKEDNTYGDLREKSLMNWLNEMQEHDDLAVRGGVALAKGYIESLKAEIDQLKQENILKNEYLKKMANSKQS